MTKLEDSKTLTVDSVISKLTKLKDLYKYYRDRIISELRRLTNYLEK
jgi:hypothetical protein